MAILGVLLLLCAAGLAVDVVVQNTSSIGVDVLGKSFSLSPGWLFVAGVATGVVALLGVNMLVAGARRARCRRAVLNDTRSSAQELQAERDHLAVELERERAGRPSETAERRPGNRPTVLDRESAVIDLADERPSEPGTAEYAAARRGTGREAAADREEGVEPARRGFFHRRP